MSEPTPTDVPEADLDVDVTPERPASQAGAEDDPDAEQDTADPTPTP